MSAKIRLFFIHIDKSFVFDEPFRGVKKESGRINSKILKYEPYHLVGVAIRYERKRDKRFIHGRENVVHHSHTGNVSVRVGIFDTHGYSMHVYAIKCKKNDVQKKKSFKRVDGKTVCLKFLTNTKRGYSGEEKEIGTILCMFCGGPIIDFFTVLLKPAAYVFSSVPSRTVGIGTLICVVLVGPVVGFFLPVNEKMVEGIVSRF